MYDVLHDIHTYVDNIPHIEVKVIFVTFTKMYKKNKIEMSVF